MLISSTQETFYTLFNPALFATKRLEDAISRHISDFNNPRRTHPPSTETLWLDYLVWRCRNGRHDAPAEGRRHVEICTVADSLVGYHHARQEEADYDTILRDLCRLAVYSGTEWPGRWYGWGGWPIPSGINRALNPDGDLLSAACYFGHVDLVRELLDKGLTAGAPREGNGSRTTPATTTLFASPGYLAAWAGHQDVVLILLDHLTRQEETQNDYAMQPRTFWWQSNNTLRRHGHYEALVGAASRPDLDLVKLVLFYDFDRKPVPEEGEEDEEDPRSTRHANLPTTTGQGPPPTQEDELSHVTQNHSAWSPIYVAMLRAASPEIYDFLSDLLEPVSVAQDQYWQLENHNISTRDASGDLTMLRHLIKNVGADPADRARRLGPALQQAVRNCDDDVVDYLLSKGADPNLAGTIHLGTPLAAAARAGSMAMYQKLLDAGAQISGQKDSHTGLRFAILREHTAMAEMLLRLGVGSERSKSLYLGQAREAGLESMVELLREWGAKESPNL